MAYENVTYEQILHRMIDRVTVDYPNLDTREGSILFNALAPAALELAIMYTELDNVLKESFVNTASRDYILTACEQIGMPTYMFAESSGTHKGVFNIEVPIGSRWNCELYNYIVTEYIGLDENNNHEYQMICETPGVAPNTTVGDLTAITYVDNELNYAKITECLIEGEDETPDENIKQAYYDYVNSTAVDGNVKQYERWCSEYSGIGNYKIIPLWNGANTVKVSILSASNERASDELVAEFQEYLDPNSEGMGNGVAPIGSIVTVDTASTVNVAVGGTVTMQAGYSDTSTIDTAINNYLRSIAYKKNNVAYMSLGSVILSVPGVDAINDLTLNGGTSDIMLDTEEIPVLYTCDWVVK